MTEIKKIELNDGNKIPEIGIGVYCIYDEEECRKNVLEALKQGYRHIDTAELYKNEAAVGKAIKESGIPREEIFVTTKVWIDRYSPKKCRKSLDESLKKLDTGYIDLVLLHQRYNDYMSAWKVLEEYKEKGLIKSIGVSNFTEKELTNLLNNSKYVPVVNQVEVHPYCQRKKLKEFMDKHNIKLEAWFPLGHGDKNLINNAIFTELANKYHKSNAQIILKWHLQKEHIIFPKASLEKHLEENKDLYDFTLTEEDMNKIETLNKERSYFMQPDFLQYLFYSIARYINFR